MFYLQEILGTYAPMNDASLLCAVVQFYLLFVLLLWAFQLLRQWLPLRMARLLVFGPTGTGVARGHRGIAGLAAAAGHLLRPLVFVLPGDRSVLVAGGGDFVNLVLGLHGRDAGVLQRQHSGGVGTGLAIVGIRPAGTVGRKMQRGRILLYVGSRSYSFFLVHVFVGSNTIRLLLRQQAIPETFLVLVGFFAIGLLVSFIATEILYRLIERPSHQLARKVAWESPALAPVAERPATPPAGLDLPAARACWPPGFQRRWPELATAIRSESSLADSGLLVRGDLVDRVVRRARSDVGPRPSCRQAD